MPIIRAADAPYWPLQGWLMTGLAAPSRGSRELSVWRVLIDPHTEGPLHRVDHDIVFVVVEGTATAVVDGEAVAVPAGDAFLLPAGRERAMANRSAEPCVLINAMPAGASSQRSDGSASSIPWAL